MSEEPQITVQKSVAYMPVYMTMVEDDYPDIREAIMRALTGPPPTARERAQARGRQLIEQARRDTERCKECGCHPDEHGDY